MACYFADFIIELNLIWFVKACTWDLNPMTTFTMLRSNSRETSRWFTQWRNFYRTEYFYFFILQTIKLSCIPISQLCPEWAHGLTQTHWWEPHCSTQWPPFLHGLGQHDAIHSLITSGVLKYIDYLKVEFHSK